MNQANRTEIIFSPHTTEFSDDAGLLAKELQKLINTSKANSQVTIILEGAGTDPEIAEGITVEFTKNELPSYAYYAPAIRQQYETQQNHTPDRALINKNVKTILDRHEADRFKATQLRELDKAVDKISSTSRKRRENLHLEIEDADTQLAEIREVLLRMTELDKKFYQAIATNNYKLALQLFKECTLAFARSNDLRENVLFDQIMSRISQERENHVVIQLGSAHTRLAHMLKSAGVNVDWNFYHHGLTSQVSFGPRESIARKISFSGLESITDAEWVRAMIGTLIENGLKASNDYGYLKSDFNGSAQLVNRIVRKINIAEKRQNLFAGLFRKQANASSITQFDFLDTLMKHSGVPQAAAIVATLKLLGLLSDVDSES